MSQTDMTATSPPHLGKEESSAADRGDRSKTSSRSSATTELISSVTTLYRCFCLDFLIDMAFSVCVDVADSPMRYRGLSDPGAFISARVEFGSSVDWARPDQRADWYTSVSTTHPWHGAVGVSTQFDRSAISVRKAAVDLTASVYGGAEAALWVAFHDAADQLVRSALNPLPSSLLGALANAAESNLDRASGLLKDPGVAMAMRTQGVDTAHWPTAVDQSGSELVAALSVEFATEHSLSISPADFSDLQRLASAAEAALEMIARRMPTETPEETDSELLSAVLAWDRASSVVSASTRVR